MLETILNQNLPLYGMAFLCFIGVTGMLTTHLSYRRSMRSTKEKIAGLKERWLEMWKTRDRLLNRMNRYVWYPSLLCTGLLALAVFLNGQLPAGAGLSLNYIYLGAAIPIVLLLFRQGLDFTYREELLLHSLRDYVEQEKSRKVRMEGWTASERTAGTDREEVPVSADRRLEDAIQKEAAIDHITESIRQTAAAGSHFRNMLTPEEEEIMRDIIREFME